MPLPAALLAFLASPAGQAALAAGIPLAAQGLQSAGSYGRRRLFGPNQEEQHQERLGQLEQRLLGQMDQPYDWQQRFQPIREEAERRYREEDMPALLQYFGNTGSQYSSSLHNALASGQQGLRSRLAGLGAEFEQSGEGLEQARRGALQNYLSNQQNIGQQQHEFNQSSLLQALGTGVTGLNAYATQQRARSPLNNLQQGYGQTINQPWNVTQNRKEGVLAPLIQTAGQVAGAYLGGGMR